MADLTKLAAILRAAGLEVVEIDGWQNRGRPGSFDPTGVLCHHTAGKGDGLADAKSMFTRGRPDLNPPLCQLALSRKGVWYVGAAGRANHAGRCKPIGGLKAYPGRGYGDGNAQMVGVEAQNDGREPWPQVQYDAYVRGVAAITKAYGWRAPLGHKETSLEGKPDPHFDMAQFRRDVAAVTSTPAPTAPATSPEEDDMSMTEKVVPSPMLANEKFVSPIRALDLVMRWSLEARDNAIQGRKIAEAQALKGSALTPDEVKAAVREALSEAAQIDVVVRSTAPEATA